MAKKKNKKKAEDSIVGGMEFEDLAQMIQKITEENPEAMQGLMAMMDNAIVESRGEDDRKIAKRKKSLESKFQKSPKQFELLIELAEMENDLDQRVALLRRAVDAAEAAHPKFREPGGCLSADKKGNAYLDAVYSLANALLYCDETEESAQRLNELLDKDPDDSRSIRYVLLELYCRQNQLDEAEKLVDAWRDVDDSPFIQMTLIALQLSKTGPSPELRAMVVEQMRSNPDLVPFLLGDESGEFDPWDELAPGSPREAEEYSRMFRTLWRSIPGACHWLEGVYGDQLPQVTRDDLEEEIEELIEDVEDLRKSRQVWYCQLHDVKDRSKAIDDDELLLCIVKVGETETPLCMENVERDLAPQRALVEILQACVDPESGSPVKPKTIQFLDPSLEEELKPWLARCEIKTALVSEPPDAVRLMIEQGFGLREFQWDIEAITDAPLSPEVIWEIDWLQLEDWIPGENGEYSQPWVLVIASHEDSGIRATRVDTGMPDEPTFRSLLAQAVLSPMAGEPQRPGIIEVRQPNQRVAIKEIADEMGCEVQIGPCHLLNVVMAQMPGRSNGSLLVSSSLLDAEGVTPELMEELFVASAEFYRSRVYSRVRPVLVLEMRCPQISPRDWYVVTMGQNGQEIGLSLLNSKKAAETMLSGRAVDPELQASLITGVTYSLDGKQLQSPKDVAAAEQFGWPVPGPDAWPKIFGMTKGKLSEVELEDLQLSIVAIRSILHAFGKSRGEFPLNVRLGDQTVEVQGRVLDLSRS